MTAAAPAKSTAIRNGVAAACAGILLYALADQAVFGSGWYEGFLDPNSLAGRIYLTVGLARGAPPAAVPEVAVVGNSVLAEGFSARSAGSATSGQLRFWNFTVPASTPRAWYYLLRAIDPTAHRYRAIVLQADQYSDEDRAEPLADSIADLHIIDGLLAPADVPDFAFSFQDPRLRFEALRGGFFKGYIFKQDVQAFLEAPKQRLEIVDLARREYAHWVDDYQGHPESLRGLTVDWKSRSLHVPPGVPPEIEAGLRVSVLRPAVARTGDEARFRSRWFGRIVERYRRSGTLLIFIRPPRGPAVNPGFDRADDASTIHRLARQPHVTLIRPEAFQMLESPEWFWDAYHMNAAGRRRFSAMLAGELEPILGKEDR